MKLRALYDFAVKIGMEADPRSKAAVEKDLADAKKAYTELKDEDKEFFDEETLVNPYGDSRILYGADDREITKMLVGVDAELQELLLVAELNRQGMGIDLLFAHHPEGAALASLSRVMDIQTDLMEDIGIRPALASGVMGERIKAVHRSTASSNQFRSIDAARLLDIPYICMHTVCDNLVASFVTDYLKGKSPENLGELLKALKDIPEYRHCAKNGVPPRIDVGDKNNKLGKFFVDFTGGTSGPKKAYQEMADHGINTIISMHNNDEQIKIAKEINLNLVCAGHMASDSIGINLLMDALEKEGVEAVAASGFIRIKR